MYKMFKNIFLSSLIALLLCGLMPVGTFAEAEDNIIASGSLELKDGEINASELYEYLKYDLFKEHQTNAYVVWCKNGEENSINIDDQSTGTITLPNGLVKITAFSEKGENLYDSLGIGELDVAVYYTLDLENPDEYFIGYIGDNKRIPFAKSKPETSTKIKLKSDANTNGFCLINNIGVDNNKFYHDKKYTITTQTINGYFFTSINGDDTETTKVLTGKEINEQGIRVVYTKGTGLELRVQKEDNINITIKDSSGAEIQPVAKNIYSVASEQEYTISVSANKVNENSAYCINSVWFYGQSSYATLIEQDNGVSTYKFKAKETEGYSSVQIYSHFVKVQVNESATIDHWQYSPEEFVNMVGAELDFIGQAENAAKLEFSYVATYGDTNKSIDYLYSDVLGALAYSSTYSTTIKVSYTTKDKLTISDSATVTFTNNSRSTPINIPNNPIPLIKGTITADNRDEIYLKFLDAVVPDSELLETSSPYEYQLYKESTDDVFGEDALFEAIKNISDGQEVAVSFRVRYTKPNNPYYNPSYLAPDSNLDQEYVAKVNTVKFKLYDYDPLIRLIDGNGNELTSSEYNGNAVDIYAEAYYIDNEGSHPITNSKDNSDAFDISYQVAGDGTAVDRIIEVGDYMVNVNFDGGTYSNVTYPATGKMMLPIEVTPCQNEVFFEVGDYTSCRDDFDEENEPVSFVNLDSVLRSRAATSGLVIKYSGLCGDLEKVIEDYQIKYTGNDLNKITFELGGKGKDYFERNYGDGSNVTQPAIKVESGDRTFEHGQQEKTLVETIAPTCTEEGYNVYLCGCGEEYEDEFTSPLGHKFGEWKVVKEATTSEKGLEVRECSACDEKEEREIAKLSPTPTPETSHKEKPTYYVPNTAAK